MLDKHSLLKIFIPVSCDDKDTDYEKKKKKKKVFSSLINAPSHPADTPGSWHRQGN